MDEQPTVHIDQSALMRQMADKIITDFMLALMPDEKTRKMLLGILAVHRKYGIDAATSIKIVTDLAEILKEEPNESDR